jgi:hypothetical protein
MKSMRRTSLLIAILSGCTGHQTHISADGTVLGRVVIYRNGVAFYERNARVIDGSLTVHVPRDRVDDFLKSLTIVDRSSGKPLSVTIPRSQADDGSYLTMTLETPAKQAADVLLTYVTEAPAWKPSYRVVVGGAGKVMLEGWAIVDNVSGEDWKNVLVGVGASSALSFRYDLWSVRRIDRDLLQGEQKFAVAPPTGMSPYTEAGGGEELVTLEGNEASAYGVSFSGSSSLDQQYYVDGVNTTGLSGSQSSANEAGTIEGVVTDSRTGEKLAGATVVIDNHTAITDGNGYYRIPGIAAGKYDVAVYYADQTLEQRGVRVESGKTTPVYQRIDQGQSGGEVIRVAASAPTIDPTSTSQGVTIDKNYIKNVPVAGRRFDSALGTAAGSQGDAYGVAGGVVGGDIAGNAKKAPSKLLGLADKIVKTGKDIVIESQAPTIAEARQKAETVRNKLVDDGVAATRIRVAPRADTAQPAKLRVLAVAPGAMPEATAPPSARTGGPDTPVGESRFMADRPMTVKAGTSAMVSMVHTETTGGVVYLYDPISDRGDARYAFKAVRLDNPTDDALEPGPVTVYGEGRFIGEGITEPVPPHAAVVVPFALDKQIVVSRNDAQTSRIARLVTVQRGQVTAEIQERREAKFTVTSRLAQPSKVYIRHRLQEGWTIIDAPERMTKVGDSQLFEVELGAGETKYVTIAEATPVERTLELSSDEALDMMKVYIDEPDATSELRTQLAAVLATHRAGADLADKIETLRDELGEYKSREGELHAQLVTLKLVRSGGDLTNQLRQRLQETSDKVQKTTLALVDAKEQLMLTKVKFQNQLADLHLTDVTAKK